MSTTWEQLGRKIIHSSMRKRIPVAGQFELTVRCNLHCKMCYVCNPANDASILKQERTAGEWIKLAEEARDAGMLYLLLTGGEIFMRKDFKVIYEAISKMGFNIELYTNATMITPEIAKWLGSIPPSRVGITLYGASPDTYQKVTGNGDAYHQATRGVDMLLSEGMKLWLKTAVTQDNVNDFDTLAEFADKRGVKFGIINYISPRREGHSTVPQTERLSPSELIQYETHVNEYFNNKSAAKQIKEKINSCSEEVAYLDFTPAYNPDDAFKCPSGKSAFWVTWDGRMTPCSLMSSPSSFPFEKGFTEAWKDLQKLCSLIPSCSACTKCNLKDYCMACPARLKAETGSYEKPAQYLCDLALLKKNL